MAAHTQKKGKDASAYSPQGLRDAPARPRSGAKFASSVAPKVHIDRVIQQKAWPLAILAISFMYRNTRICMY